MKPASTLAKAPTAKSFGTTEKGKTVSNTAESEATVKPAAHQIAGFFHGSSPR
ncbi:hypothetical protein SS05631_c16120 [Sinorhizobium sp. CCBAU 05631]|nr:hypothetical protein SS05631_c16120 [Sinorhizobium sp. CCBAU 05631]